MKVDDILSLAAIGGVGYILYKLNSGEFAKEAKPFNEKIVQPIINPIETIRTIRSRAVSGYNYAKDKYKDISRSGSNSDYNPYTRPPQGDIGEGINRGAYSDLRSRRSVYPSYKPSYIEMAQNAINPIINPVSTFKTISRVSKSPTIRKVSDVGRKVSNAVQKITNPVKTFKTLRKVGSLVIKSARRT